MTAMSLGERIADLLVAEGIDKFFSLPEVTFGKLHQALGRQGVPLVAPHHEASAGYIAEAYAQMTGQIGVCGGSVGPGAMNLYTAIANSWEENLPILYLGSERTLIARNSPRRSRFQAPPNIDVVKPITKYAAIVEDPLQADDIFHEGFRHLRSGTPGPVYIGLPFDLLLEQREFGPVMRPDHYRPATLVNTVAESEIEKAAVMLASARRPLIIGGSGVRGARVVAICSTQNLAYVRSLGADQAIDYRHERIADAVAEFAPGGVDLIIDAVGGDTLTEALDLLRPGGTLSSIMTLKAGDGPDLAAAERRGVHAKVTYNRYPSGGTLAKIAALLNDGRVRPPPAQIMPLAQAAHAHRVSEAGHVRGMLLLRVGTKD